MPTVEAVGAVGGGRVEVFGDGGKGEKTERQQDENR